MISEQYIDLVVFLLQLILDLQLELINGLLELLVLWRW